MAKERNKFFGDVTKVLRLVWDDFLDFSFPRLCVICDDLLTSQEIGVCLHCYFALPFSVYEYGVNNPVAKSLWGRTPIVGGYSLFHYRSSTGIAKLVHAVKYDGQMKLAEKLGKTIANNLIESECEIQFSHLIPVPMHPKKLLKRGCNPAAQLAYGMSEVLNIPVMENALFKGVQTTSQTNKSRLERWLETENVYGFDNGGELWEYPVLVDDVITTGATAERCLRAMYVGGLPKASVVGLAHTL